MDLVPALAGVRSEGFACADQRVNAQRWQRLAERRWQNRTGFECVNTPDGGPLGRLKVDNLLTVQGLCQAVTVRVGPSAPGIILGARVALRVKFIMNGSDGCRNPTLSDPGHAVLPPPPGRRPIVEP